MQSIRQLLPPVIEKDSIKRDVNWAIPCVSIYDSPRYTYRGLMLDVCRHFMPVEFVKRYIDYLAYHKMNRFHWHLTDDQGWRIEIKKYPKLTSVGSFRDRTLIGHYSESPRKWKMERYGNFYTQEEIKEVVEYARKRFVTVIPEIEMPGHSLAALAAYPKLSCTGGPFEVSGIWGVFNDIYCTREENFKFLEDVLSEVIELFPSKYIHIGGDEAPKIRWSRCHACQERIKSEGLKNEQELQSYFIRRIEKFLQTKGKQIIGWDEILEGGLAPNATVMSWRGTEGGIAAAKQHHDVIMTPGHSVYLDHYQSKLAEEPIAIGGYLPLQKVYEYNPTPASLTDEEARHILGVQGNVWTEYIHTSANVEYMAFPRAAAIAESAWSPQSAKNYPDFLKRLDFLLLHYDAMGMNYCRSHKKTGL
jgi:hexosaminidase